MNIRFRPNEGTLFAISIILLGAVLGLGLMTIIASL